MSLCLGLIRLCSLSGEVERDINDINALEGEGREGRGGPTKATTAGHIGIISPLSLPRSLPPSRPTAAHWGLKGASGLI